MRKNCIALLILLTIIFPPACGSSIKEAVPKTDTNYTDTADIEDVFAQFFQKFLADDPTLISSLAFPEELVPRDETSLTPVSYGYSRWRYQLCENTLDVLTGFDDADLTPNQQLNKDILEWSLSCLLAGQQYMYYGYQINPMNGPHIFLPWFMEYIHTINDRQDATNYIERLKKIEMVFAQYLNAIRIQTEKGVIPPDMIIRETIKGIEDFTEPEPAENSLYLDFADKIKDLEIADKETLKVQLEEVIKDIVYPAYHELKDYLKALKGQGITLGVWELPRGKEYYEYLVRQYTTLDIHPDQLYRQAKEDVDNLQQLMKDIVAEMQIEDLRPIQVLAQIHQESGNVIGGRENMLQTFNEIIDTTEEILPRLFNTFPEDDLIIMPVASHREQYRPSLYIPPARDGSRPGVFKLNLSRPQSLPSAYILAYHEAVPGHHFQISIEQQQQHIPHFRSLFNFPSYLEGWASYAEGLPFAYGLHDDDLESRLVLAWRHRNLAALTVADIGMHYKEWSENEIFSYLWHTMGIPVTSFPRIVGNPGEVLVYYTGHRALLDMRDKARTELREAFDIGEFHDVILLNGSMPLHILQQQVDKYIEQKLKHSQNTIPHH